MTTTLYTEINDSLFAKLAKIKLLVCDVDGVFLRWPNLLR